MRTFICLLLSALLQSAIAFLPQKSGVTVSYWGVSSRYDLRRFAETETKANSPLRIIIAGAPASGKGTQCEVIKEKFGVVHLSTGDMLRAAVAARTDVGRMAKDFMDSGNLVPDDVIIGVVCGIWRQRDDVFPQLFDSHDPFFLPCHRFRTDSRKVTAKRVDGCWMVSLALKPKQRHLRMLELVQTASCSLMSLTISL